jgi:antitoxin (DNA-binding transcriptional repressor) of toxin-antitoxin stability system
VWHGRKQSCKAFVSGEPVLQRNASSSPEPKNIVVYNCEMAKRVIHISETEAAATNVATLLARVRAGAEIVIENDAVPVAVLHAADPMRRTISECIALLPEDSTATIDPDFAKDVGAAVESHREPLNPPAWD